MPNDNIEKPDQNVVDKTDIEKQIKDNIKDIKSSVEQVRQEIDTFDKEKKNLVKEVIEQKNKEIEKKKDDIEKKKKETKELIDKLRVDVKLTELAGKVNPVCDAYEKELNDLDVKSSGFREKLKAFPGKALEWAKENPKTAIAVTAGSILAIWGISRLFRKKKKEKKEGSEGGKEKKGFWKKALKRIGLGALAGVVRWNWDTIKSWFGSKTNKPNDGKENLYNDFDKLSEADKGKYLTVADQVNSFQDELYASEISDGYESPTSLGVDQKKMAGAVLFGLDNQYKNMGNLLSEDGIGDYISAKNSEGRESLIKGWVKNKLKVVQPFLAGSASFIPFIGDNWEKSVNDWFADPSISEQRNKELDFFFRQYIQTLSYVYDKKNQVEYVLAKQVIEKDGYDGENFAGLDEEDKKELIQDALEDEERKEKEIKPLIKTSFLSKQIKDIPELLKQYGCNEEIFSPVFQESVDELDETRNDILDKDEDTTVLDRMAGDLESGKLSEEVQEEALDMCDKLIEDAEGQEGSGFLYSHIDWFCTMMNLDSSQREKFLETSHMKNMPIEFKKLIQEYKEKIKNNTLTSQDFEVLKNTVNRYFAFKKEVELAINAMSSISSENPDLWPRILDGFWQLEVGFWQSISNWKGGNWHENVAKLASGLVVNGTILYIAGGRGVGGIAARGGEVALGPIKVGLKGLRYVAGKTIFTGWGWAREIRASKDPEKLLQYAVMQGELSDNYIAKIAKEHKIKTATGKYISNIEEVLLKYGGNEMTESKAKLIKKYIQQKNIRELLFDKSRSSVSSRDRVKDRTVNRKISWNFELKNANLLDDLAKLDNHIASLAQGSSKKVLMESFLKHTNNLNYVDELIATKTFDKLSVSEAKNIGKTLGKYMKNFSSLDEFKKYQTFLAGHGNDITHYNNFARRAAKNWNEVKKITNQSEIKALNTSRMDRRLDGVKDNFRKASEQLRKIKFPKKYGSTINEAANNLDNLANVSNDDLKLLKFGYGDQAWIANMTKNKELMENISRLKNNKEFLKALSEAKSPEKIREVFKTFQVGQEIPEELANTLAKTKNLTKIKDTFTYAEKFKHLGKIGRILKNPTIKVVGRVLGKALVVATPIIGGIMAYSTYQEGVEISKTNEERGKYKKQQSKRDGVMTVLWTIDGAIALGGTASVVGAIPAWIVSGIMTGILGTAEGIKYYTYDTFDKYSKNYQDFLGSSELYVKQHILSVALGSNKVDSGIGEFIARQFKDLSHLAEKTKGEGMKALLYMEEWKKNGLAMEDISNTERMEYLAKQTSPVTKQMIGEAQDKVDQNVNKRYTYLQSLGIEKSLTVEKIKNGGGMQAIDQLIRESELVLQNNGEFHTPEKTKEVVKTYKSSLEKEPENLKKLDAIWEKDPRSLVYMQRFAYDFDNYLQQNILDENGQSVVKDGIVVEDKVDEINQNIGYLNTYMLYKSMTTGVDIKTLMPGQEIECLDMESVRNFLVDFKLVSLPAKELYGSSDTIQNILYRIATEVVGATISNTKENILDVFKESSENENSYGLYFDGGKRERLSINGNYFWDEEYAGNDKVTIQKIRDNIQAKINSNDLIDVGTGDKVFNKEIGKRYLTIFDQEIARA